MTVYDNNKNWIKTKRKFNEFKRAIIKVGIQGFETNGEGKYVAQYAADNEFGTDKIPERSFIRSTDSEQRENWMNLLNEELTEIVEKDKGVQQGLTTVAIVVRNDIVDKINNIYDPPLAEETIKRKKSSKPLIDTGIMRNSIKYVIL